MAQSDRDAGNPDGAWYLAFIWFSGVAGGSAYGVGCRDRHIWPLIRDGLPSGSVVLTVAAMALIGAALGMALTSALAPPGFLVSGWGRRWMMGIARTDRPWLFRVRVAGYAALPVVVTVVLLGQAFVFR